MFHTISIFTELKNTDLHAMSATEALVDLMGVTALKRLKRYQHWELTLAGDIDAVLKNSYAIVNVNKERYMVDALPELTVPEGCHGFRLEVHPSTPVDRSALAESLTQKSGVEVKTISKSLIWEVILSHPGHREQVQAFLMDNVVNTTSRTQGLLVNPILETVMVLG